MNLSKIANVLIFQWFFIRLAKSRENRVQHYNLLGYDLMPDGSMSSRGYGDMVTIKWWSFKIWVLPCSGWWSKSIYLNNTPKFINLIRRN